MTAASLLDQALAFGTEIIGAFVSRAQEQIDDAGLSTVMTPAEPDGGGPGCWPSMNALFPVRGLSPLHPTEAKAAARANRRRGRG